MSLEKTFSSLITSFHLPFLFFIPKRVIPDDVKEFIDSFGTPNIYDKIIFIDSTGNGYDLSQKPRLLELLGKSLILDKNILILLDCKKQLQTTQFEFFLEKYRKQLSMFVQITSKMHENLLLFFPDIDDPISVYFSQQKDVFQEHERALKRNFIFNFSLSPDVKEFLEKIKKDPPPNTLFDKNATTNKTNQHKIEKKKKRVYITDEEADAYLLETVFNVKF